MGQGGLFEFSSDDFLSVQHVRTNLNRPL